jgi:hypothetical protein
MLVPRSVRVVSLGLRYFVFCRLPGSGLLIIAHSIILVWIVHPTARRHKVLRTVVVPKVRLDGGTVIECVV